LTGPEQNSAQLYHSETNLLDNAVTAGECYGEAAQVYLSS
jgi:hypothetical protein